MNIIIYFAVVIAALIYTGIKSGRENALKRRERLIDEFNNEKERADYAVSYEHIKAFDAMMAEQNRLHVDDDTWDDLDMDEVFRRMDNTNSAVGREYLYYMLHNPVCDNELLLETDRLAREFTADADMRINLQEKLASMGYAGKTNFYSNITEISELLPKSNMPHIIADVLLVLSIITMVCVRADVGTVLFICILAINVMTYFKEKALIENHLYCIKCVVRMIKTAKSVAEQNISTLGDYNARLLLNLKNTACITKNFYMITSGTQATGSITEVLLDYVRIIFHIDIIRFNKLVLLVGRYSKEILDIYKTLGYLESCIAVAAYRNKLPKWSVPRLKEGNSYEVDNVYHPLLAQPVANSVNADGCILLTGSNASGKSTFLRSIAINALLSQTIATSISDNYSGDFYHIVSSMSHRDDIINGDSYYMVEIKALKKILDIGTASEHKLLCFLDEVLRGTNTVERIAASTQILKSFAQNGALCFAATHDIELTSLLGGLYSNYHFDESFEDDDVRYTYKLLKGPAETRNAIRLLKCNGYDEKIIKAAVKMTEHFEKEGVWSV